MPFPIASHHRSPTTALCLTIAVASLAAAFGPARASASDAAACLVNSDPDASLSEAKALFALRCEGFERRDCDPRPGGGWSCSSAVLGRSAPAGVVTSRADIPPDAPEASAEPDGLCFSNTGESLGAARDAFAETCAGYALRDCDPVGGGWRCSSGIIGATAPGVVGGLATPVAQEPAAPREPPASSDIDPDADAADEVPEPATNGRRVGLLGPNDLLVLHYDNCPDRDDGHAIAAGHSVVRELGLDDPWVVNGTCGDGIRDQFISASGAVMRAAWGGSWLDADADRDVSISASADAWAAVLANGGDVWIAEGGPSDFSAYVVDRLRQRNPELDLKRVHVVQHSSGRGFNERQSERIDVIKRYTDYVTISDGNNAGNGTADFNEQSSAFVAAARASRYRTAWNAAFDYLTPDCTPRSGRCKLDFSDTVELLHIVGDRSTLTVSDFAARYLR